MADLDQGASHRFTLIPRHLRWRLVLAFTPVLAAAVFALAVVSDRAASQTLHEQALQQLHILQVRAADDIERHFRTLETGLVSLASDPSTLIALRMTKVTAPDHANVTTMP